MDRSARLSPEPLPPKSARRNHHPSASPAYSPYPTDDAYSSYSSGLPLEDPSSGIAAQARSRSYSRDAPVARLPPSHYPELPPASMYHGGYGTPSDRLPYDDVPEHAYYGAAPQPLSPPFTESSDLSAPKRRGEPKTKNASKKARMAHHWKEDIYFRTKPPSQWAMRTYLATHSKARNEEAQTVVKNWVSMLAKIAGCKDRSCCPVGQYNRAVKLFKRYKEKAESSDKAAAQEWIRQRLDSGDEGQAEASAPTTINNIGPQYYAPIHSATSSQVLHPNAVSLYPPVQGPTQGLAQGPAQGLVQNQTQDTVDVSSSFSSICDEEEDDSPFAAHERFDQRLKWKLNTGRFVEDVLLDHTDDNNTAENRMAQAFVVDVTSPVMRRWFKTAEWSEICASVPPLPPNDPVLVDSLIRFDGVHTLAALRDVLETTSYRVPGTCYDRATHFNAEWADLVLRNILVLFETPSEPLRGNNNAEDWFSMQIWAAVVDKCYLDIPGMTVQRKEVHCIAGARRKNRHRSSTDDRAVIGSRLDGVVRTIEDETYEYGGMEVARKWEGTTSSKALVDAWKLIKALRDMLHRLHDRVGNRKDVTPRLQVVGLLTQGLRFQVLRLCHPRGYVCLLKREENYRVSSVVGELHDLLRLLTHLAQSKDVIKDCVAAVNAPSSRSLAQVLRGESEERGPVLSWTPHTPAKTRTSNAVAAADER